MSDCELPANVASSFVEGTGQPRFHCSDRDPSLTSPLSNKGAVETLVVKSRQHQKFPAVRHRSGMASCGACGRQGE
jgi:hypothetical protein